MHLIDFCINCSWTPTKVTTTDKHSLLKEHKQYTYMPLLSTPCKYSQYRVGKSMWTLGFNNMLTLLWQHSNISCNCGSNLYNRQVEFFFLQNSFISTIFPGCLVKIAQLRSVQSISIRFSMENPRVPILFLATVQTHIKEQSEKR